MRVHLFNAHRICAISVILILILTSCAIPHLPKHPEGYAQVVSGRFSAQRNQANHINHSQGSFLWLSKPGYTELEIFSPFGQSLARLQVHTASATLLIPGQAPRQHAHAEILLSDVLGFNLPLNHFSDWLQGQPSLYSQADITRDTDGKILTIQQAGWAINYSGQTEQTNIPKQIKLINIGQGLVLRLILNHP